MELKHCASSKIRVLTLIFGFIVTKNRRENKGFIVTKNRHENISCAKNWMRLPIPIPVDSIAQLVERRSRNPKMRVQIPLETKCFLLCSAVSD